MNSTTIPGDGPKSGSQEAPDQGLLRGATHSCSARQRPADRSPAEMIRSGNSSRCCSRSASWSWDECPLAGPRPQPPATVPPRISSHPSPLWRHPANARAVRALRSHVQRRWDGSRRPVGSKRRPGGHRARRERRIDHLRRYRQRSTLRATPVHHRCSRHPRPSRDAFREGVRIRPKGDLTSWCTGVDDAYRSGGTDEGYVALAVMAGSIPAWAPPRSGAPTRALRCSPDRVGVAGSGEGVTVPPEGARVAAEAKTPRQWSSGSPRSVGTVLSCKGPP